MLKRPSQLDRQGIGSSCYANQGSAYCRVEITQPVDRYTPGVCSFWSLSHSLQFETRPGSEDELVGRYHRDETRVDDEVLVEQ